MIIFVIRIQALAYIRQAEDRLGLAAIQCLIELALDIRANQQRELRMVGAQMNAHPFRRTQPVQRQRNFHQWLDVRHAHQPEADALAAAGIDTVVLPMQCRCSV